MNIETEIDKSVQLLKKGKILLYPTDTIWGIGCDATSSKSIQKIYKLKGRSENKAMIVLVDSAEMIEKYVKIVPPIAYDLIANSKSPLTIVYPGARNLAKSIIADDGTIAIRVVDGPFCTEIIRKFGKPIVSTSANFSDQPTAQTFDDIDVGIKNGVDHVVGVLHDKVRTVKASTIIKIEPDGTFFIIRD